MGLTRCGNGIVMLPLAVAIAALLCNSFVANGAEAVPSSQASSTPIIIEGLVYCKTCRYKDKPTLKRASPLPGATVKLRYATPKYRHEQFATTNQTGGFKFTAAVPVESPKDVQKYSHVYLVSAPPKAECSVPTYFLGGLKGAAPQIKEHGPNGYFGTVGPFAFDTPNKCAN